MNHCDTGSGTMQSMMSEICSGSGYKGRLGIHELIEGTAQIKQLIKHQATSSDLAKQALKQGMTTLKQDGIHKVFLFVGVLSQFTRTICCRAYRLGNTIRDSMFFKHL